MCSDAFDFVFHVCVMCSKCTYMFSLSAVNFGVCVCVFWLFKQLLQVAVISITKSQPRVQQRVRTAWQWKLKQKTMTLFKEHLKMRQVAVNDPVNMLSRLTNIWKVLNLLCWWEKDKAAVLQSPVQLISLWKALCLSPISLSSFFQISLFVALGVRPKGKDNCWLICPSGCPSVQHFDVQNQPPNRLHWYFDSYRRNICMHLEIFQKKNSSVEINYNSVSSQILNYCSYWLECWVTDGHSGTSKDNSLDLPSVDSHSVRISPLGLGVFWV